MLELFLVCPLETAVQQKQWEMENGLQPKKNWKVLFFTGKKRKKHPTHVTSLSFVFRWYLLAGQAVGFLGQQKSRMFTMDFTMDFVLSVSLEINQVVLSTFQRLPRHVGANRKVSHQNSGTGIFSDSKEIFGFRL